MHDLGVRPTEIRAIGGGATSPLWLQLQADVYGAPIHRMAIEEGAAYGAALLGHVAAGTFSSVDEATSVVRTLDAVTEPDPKNANVYEDTYAVYRSLYDTLRHDMHRLAGFAES
jgi:xylulokinase